jgi:hypothetical protein
MSIGVKLINIQESDHEKPRPQHDYLRHESGWQWSMRLPGECWDHRAAEVIAATR